MSEDDTRANYIDPMIAACGWMMEHITRQYYFTADRKLYGNKRGKRKFVDYLLKHKQTQAA